LKFNLAMPNFFSAFSTEVFRPIVTLLIPGAIGISTWFIALVWHFTTIRTLVVANHGETGLVLLLAMIFAGLVFEDLGARVEKKLDEKADERTEKHHSDEWYSYLRTAFLADPVGRRYVRTIVLRLKFELGVAFSMLSAAVGLFWLWSLGLSRSTFVITLLVCILFVVWGLWEATETHSLLAKNHANLLQDIRVVGK
jgi:hypothetical protein